jgi:uncharacterized protein (TIGR00725 family)
VKRRAVVGVMGAGENAQPQDTVTAFALGQAIAKEGWVLLSGGRKSGVMEAVNEGAKNADGNALTIGILPGKDKKQLSDCVDVGIVTGWVVISKHSAFQSRRPLYSRIRTYCCAVDVTKRRHDQTLALLRI